MTCKATHTRHRQPADLSVLQWPDGQARVPVLLPEKHSTAQPGTSHSTVPYMLVGAAVTPDPQAGGSWPAYAGGTANGSKDRTNRMQPGDEVCCPDSHGVLFCWVLSGLRLEQAPTTAQTQTGGCWRQAPQTDSGCCCCSSMPVSGPGCLTVWQPSAQPGQPLGHCPYVRAPGCARRDALWVPVPRAAAAAASSAA